MRNNQEILNEVHKQCTEDNCQSWNSIAILSMAKVLEEQKEKFIDELQRLSDNYDVCGEYYVIYKSTLDDYIEKIESEF
jgi:hypothetical protein